MNGFLISGEGLVIAVVSVVLSLFSVVVRMKVVDQVKLKKQREEIKQLQSEIKEQQKKGDTKRVGEIYSRMMELNSDMMKGSFKPMIFTMIPFLLVFSWMRGSYDFTMTDVVIVNPLPEGVSLSDVVASNDGFFNQSAGMLVWKVGSVVPGNSSLLEAQFKIDPGGLDSIRPSMAYYKSSTGNMMEPLTANASNGFVFLQSLDGSGSQIKMSLFYNNTKSNIVARFAGFELGWLGWYFICSMASSMVLNKVFKIS
jgi:uncharacterized membrane protein (DUF106 family)